MTNKEWNINKAISYFKGKAVRIESEEGLKKPHNTSRESEKRLFDIRLAYFNFYNECADCHCHTQEALKEYLSNPNFDHLKKIASENYFSEATYMRIIKNCPDEIQKEIKNGDIDFL